MVERGSFAEYSDNDGDYIGATQLTRDSVPGEVTMYLGFTSHKTRDRAFASMKKCGDLVEKYGMELMYDWYTDWLWKDIVEEFQNEQFLLEILRTGKRADVVEPANPSVRSYLPEIFADLAFDPQHDSATIQQYPTLRQLQPSAFNSRDRVSRSTTRKKKRNPNTKIRIRHSASSESSSSTAGPTLRAGSSLLQLDESTNRSRQPDAETDLAFERSLHSELASHHSRNDAGSPKILEGDRDRKSDGVAKSGSGRSEKRGAEIVVIGAGGDQELIVKVVVVPCVLC